MKVKFVTSFLLLNAIVYSEPCCEEEICCMPDCCEDICNCSCSGVFGVGGNWLYLTPYVSDREYARVLQVEGTEFFSFIDGSRKCLKTKHSSGYEIFAYYQSPVLNCCYSWNVRAGFLSHENSSKSQTTLTSPSFLTPLIGFIPDQGSNQFLNATSKMDSDFEALNGEFGWRGMNECPFSFRFFAGLQYADLKQKFQVEYFNPSQVQNEEEISTTVILISKFSGIGPRIGFSTRWDFLCGLGLFGDFASNLLIAKKRGCFFQESFTPIAMAPDLLDLQWNEKFCSITQLIPGFEAKVGLFFHFDWFSCVAFNFEGGYQVLHYFNALQNIKIAGNNFANRNETDERLIDSSTTTTKENFALAGWFIGGSFQF